MFIKLITVRKNVQMLFDVYYSGSGRKELPMY